jgi:RHS repeat-associated protein
MDKNASTLGESYNRARYYDQSVGRFVREDPIGFGSNINFYSYVRNSPISLIDPGGLGPVIGGPVRPNQNTVVCNGHGRMQVHLSNAPDPACIKGCQRAHEEQHIRDLDAANPTICLGVPAGLKVTFSSRKELAGAEIAATQIELQCLSMLKGGPSCSDCSQKDIDQRIDQLRRYLADNLKTYFQ